jgi:UDPglucose--hexose-1-phosphate uridylyltransferase
MEFQFARHPHRRFNPLNGRWVLVSPHRITRPWQGKTENEPLLAKPEHDPGCYLCPRNSRANGATNPDYTTTFVFENDFAALKEDTPPADPPLHSLVKTERASGTCRVICFSPKHNQTLPVMSITAITGVVDVWADQTVELGAKYPWVQIFENKGEIMGCSNKHPHGQIWASSFIPNEPFVESSTQARYFKENRSSMLLDYAEYETRNNERVVVRNDHWLVVVPFWAMWPFESLLIPLRHVQRINELNAEERRSCADILKRFLTKYDNLFSTSFPYSFGWHGAPSNGSDCQHWQLHAHFYPPLLRSSTIKKFMVGYELLAEAQRDITAELAADKLRDLPEIHYSET